MIQHLVDGVLVGAIYALGAIGLTMVMHLLCFANFSHAELLSVGAYAALVFDKLFGALAPVLTTKIGPLSMSFALALSVLVSMAITAATAVLIDKLVFKRIRERGEELSMVFASFGVALIVRNLIGLSFGLGTTLYSPDIPFAMLLSTDPLILVRPDQIFTLSAALLLMVVLHLVLSRTTFGYALRAVAENASLAQVAGVNLRQVVIAVWVIGGALAAAAGVFYALTNQITPMIGRDLLMPVFAATIVGGIGSIYGAALGGFLVGLAANLALVVLPSGYAPSMPFLIILAVLTLRPHGLLGVARA
ncbi:branched-chain amino acid ABC transporter permease [Citreimonas sp.]|uniref:branched-chain amino acid ABC transporter permease n=1 Tax=Citreimonas sp. TaxID=3036715 RepID=UPI004059B0ED